MIDRLIPKYPAFLVIGLIIVATGVLLLMSSRDALIAVWANKFFDGETDQGLFEASQIAYLALGHTLSVWPFLGLSFLMLGIGFAIATIVQNLRATGRSILDAYAPAGDALRTTEPWFGRVFTRFLFAGILVMGFFFLLMLWWDGNLVLLKDAEFDGRTSGFAYSSYLMIERVLGALIGAGKFLSLGLLIFGILTGLVTIIWHLSFQARVLPGLTRRALVGGDANDGAEPPGPFIPGTLIKLGIAGFSIIALAMLLAFIQTGFHRLGPGEAVRRLHQRNAHEGGWHLRAEHNPPDFHGYGHAVLHHRLPAAEHHPLAEGATTGLWGPGGRGVRRGDRPPHGGGISMARADGYARCHPRHLCGRLLLFHHDGDARLSTSTL